MSEGEHTTRLDAFACGVLRPFRARMPLILIVMCALLFGPVWLVALLGAANVVLPKAVMLALMLAAFLPGALMSFSFFRAISLAKKHEAALDRGDLEEVIAIRRVMEGAPERHDRQGRANAALGNAGLLLRFERWAEARDVYATVDVDAFPDAARPLIMSEHAQATAHAGEPERAVAMLEDAMRRADKVKGYPPKKRWYLRARLGAALSLAGRHDDAVDVLGELLDEDALGDLREWSMALFFLAQSLRGAGATSDAIAVYERAAEEGGGPYVARSKAALELSRAAPLRHGGAPVLVQETELELDEAAAEQLKRVMRRPG